MIRFLFGMIRREGRGAYRRLLFFLFSIALGVGSIVGVGNLAANLEETTFHEARNLLAADLEARLTRSLSPEGEAVLSGLAQRGVAAIRVTELLGMAAPDAAPDAAEGARRSQLVEVKAVEPGYPFYGRLKIDPPAPDLFLDPNAVSVQEALLFNLHLDVGDILRLGAARFIIRGVIQREPDRVVGTFSLGPRVLLSQEGLRRTGLVQPGSRITRRILFKAPPSLTPEALKAELVPKWSAESAQLHTYREAQSRLGGFLKNFTTYLGLVGLITLLIGGIGVASNVHAFLAERIKTIAILKCLGAPSSMISSLYLLLSLILGGIGSLIGVGLGVGIHYALLPLLVRFLPPDFSFQFRASAVAQGVAMGLLTTLLFSLWPLRIVRRTPPFVVFRQEVEIQSSARVDRRFVLLAIGILFGLIGLSIWQAGSWRLGGWVVAAVGAAVPLLLGTAWGALRLIRRMASTAVLRGRRQHGLILRYGLGALQRPGREIMTIIFSVGIGALVLLTLAQVEQNLMAQLRQNIPQDAPSLFFIDLQPDQKEAFETMMAKWRFKKPLELTPLVRSRLYEINGKKVSEIQREDRPDGWYFTREYVLTYQKTLPEHNTIRRGRWWADEVDLKAPLISVETEAARHLGINVGSTVTFDIQGVLITAQVASLRDVAWGSLSTNFFFIFSPGALGGAPVTYVATVTTRPEEDLPLQNAVIQTFPNVTAIYLREVLETIAGILKEMTRVIRFMAQLGSLVGLIVLSGAIAATRAKRLHEMILFKTLGATRPLLIAMMAVEYGLLGLVSAIVAALLSMGLSWGIAHFLLDIPWRFNGALLFVGLIATVFLTVGVGFLMSYRIVGQKPLAVLRSE